MRKHFAIASTALVLLSGAAYGQTVQGPGGIQTNCNDLLVSGTHYRSRTVTPDTVIFNVKVSEWTPDTVAFLKSALDRCAAGKIRDDYIRVTKATFDEIARIPAKAKAAEEQKLAQEQANQRLKTCQSTPEYERYSAQENILSYVEELETSKAQQAHERRVAKTSGVRNLLEERQIGERIVNLNDDLKTEFARYKQLGGKASSPQKVTRERTDPCA